MKRSKTKKVAKFRKNPSGISDVTKRDDGKGYFTRRRGGAEE
jgi:hypothetical protein